MNAEQFRIADSLPVAIIGAGPIGLAAAAHLSAKGERFVVLEAGPAVGAHVTAWAHVQIFSPWRYNVDPVSTEMLTAAGWKAPDPAVLPTGGELVAEYLRPLAALPQIAPHVRLGTQVLAVARAGYDKMKTAGRDEAPFELRVRTAAADETLLARAVIDASGTWGAPNPLGANGLAAIGETACRDRVFYGIPDVLGIHRNRYAGRAVLVVGSGHSAFNTLLDLIELTRAEPATTITWAVRRGDVGLMYGGGDADALPARGSLGARVRALVATGRVQLVTGFRTAELRRDGARITAIGADGRAVGPVDEVVATTGFRPDLAMLGELRLDLDPAVESPRALASLIDPNVHSCGTVPPHGVEELRQPEANFFVVGMKSYGRAPTFLMLTGYEQVRSVVAALTGDLESARRVELELPTGVCSSTPAAAETAASCCATVPEPGAATACCTPTAEAHAVGACCEESIAAAPSACCGSEPALVTTLAAPAKKTRAEGPDDVKVAVRARYGAAALRVTTGGSSCCGASSSGSCDPITSNLYGEETAELPAEALAASLGCGNPTALAELRQGEVVLDLGSGGGIDVLLSARRVGPAGKAYGLDMTDEMLALARENQRKAGVTNVEFLEGEIEHVPLPGSTVDVIISNCVINLSPDKDAVLREAFRVLKPGGRFAVSDVVVRGEVPAAIRRSIELWIGCVAGALEESEYRAKLEKAGFEAIEVEPTRVYTADSAREFLTSAGLDPDAVAAEVDGKFISAFVRARKPVA